MTLDKAIRHGKERRRPYRRAQAVDRTCRNHGSCPRCRGNRLYNRRRAEAAARHAALETQTMTDLSPALPDPLQWSAVIEEAVGDGRLSDGGGLLTFVRDEIACVPVAAVDGRRAPIALRHLPAVVAARRRLLGRLAHLALGDMLWRIYHLYGADGGVTEIVAVVVEVYRVNGASREWKRLLAGYESVQAETTAAGADEVETVDRALDRVGGGMAALMTERYVWRIHRLMDPRWPGVSADECAGVGIEVFRRPDPPTPTNQQAQE